MRSIKSTVAAAVAVALQTAGVVTAMTTFCPQSQVCFSWGVPQAVAQAGSGNIYFQLRAPVEYTWVGLGIGSRMAGSDMFVMYADGNNNVTMSTRRGTGRVQPLHVQRDDVQLLNGSGISNGQMTANIRCSGCRNLNLDSTNGWLAAWLPGNPLNSNSPSARIPIHARFDTFDVDFSRATINTDENPFLSRANNTNTGGAVSPGGGAQGPSLGTVHGILMTVVFVGGYPLGSMLMPLLGKWIVHASWQVLAFLGMWAGFGIGYTVGNREYGLFGDSHTRLGVVVCSLMTLQPIFGWLHHMHYVKHQRRGVISHVHIWYGRLLIILGIINGGLGLQMAGSPTRFVVAYCVVAALMTVMYLCSVTFGIFRKRRSNNKSINST